MFMGPNLLYYIIDHHNLPSNIIKAKVCMYRCLDGCMILATLSHKMY